MTSAVGSGTVIGSSSVADAFGSAVISSSFAGEVALVEDCVADCDVVFGAGVFWLSWL